MAKKYHNGHKKSSARYYLDNDHSAMANMPQDVRMAQYPQGAMVDQDYGCSIEDIDAKHASMVGKMNKYKMNRKGG